MTALRAVAVEAERRWTPLISPAGYDRSPELSQRERRALRSIDGRRPAGRPGSLGTLFELQAWLGHSSPASTQHYARITPLTLTKAYTDASYFARNVRAIEVLLDRDAITTGQAAGGAPFEFYDLGHGYCTYTFFEQCPHRMACARCDFYLPKPSSEAQLLEAKDGMQRMLVEIPLTDNERAAVEGDQTAVDRLLSELVDTPTPTGATPREIGGTGPDPDTKTLDGDR